MEEINWRKKFDELVEKDAAEMAAQSARIEELTKALKNFIEGYDRLEGRLPGIRAHADFKFNSDRADARALLSPTPTNGKDAE